MEKLVSCPNNPAHRVLEHKIQAHLVKCNQTRPVKAARNNTGMKKAENLAISERERLTKLYRKQN